MCFSVSNSLIISFLAVSAYEAIIISDLNFSFSRTRGLALGEFLDRPFESEDALGV